MIHDLTVGPFDPKALRDHMALALRPSDEADPRLRAW